MHELKECVIGAIMRAKFTKVGCVHSVIAPELNKPGPRVAEGRGARASAQLFYQTAQGARAEVDAETWPGAKRDKYRNDTE